MNEPSLRPWVRQCAWLGIILAAGVRVASPAVTLVKDINAQINPVSSSPTDIVNVNGVAFFTADDGVHGLELWKSDGTEAGTVLVKDILPYNASPNPDHLVSANGLLFFSASDGVNGTELWKSDGTAAGTVLVKDIWPGNNSGMSSSYPGLTEMNGIVFFAANDGTNGTELWKSDGTAAGTVMVKNVTTPGGLSPDHLINVAGTLFFAGYDNTNGWELWKSDGTDAGTVLVKDIQPGDDGYQPNPQIAVNGLLFFIDYDGTNGYELWRSDGTAAGTMMVTNLAPGSASPQLANFTVVSGELFFSGNDLAAFPGTTLWKTDGSEAGTLMMTTIDSRSSSFANINGLLYFSVFNGNYLFKSDGTSNGTVLVFNDTGCWPYGIHALMTPFEFNGMALFMGHGCLTAGLNKTDGTSAGTVNIKSFTPGTVPVPVNVNGTLFFSAYDSVHGYELWRSDGTTNGTYMVKDIRAATTSSSPVNLTDVNGTLFFSADDGVNGHALWKSDGTTNGTTLMRAFAGSPSSLANLNGTLLFAANDTFYWSQGTFGSELWKSDGTTNGTELVKDIYPGEYDYPTYRPNNSYPYGLLALGNMVFFAAGDTNGAELWTSDGTSNGTFLVKDIRPGANSGLASTLTLTLANGQAFFPATDGTNGVELWKTDGTEAGTMMVKDIWPGSNDGLYQFSPYMTEMNGLLFFTAHDGTNSVELWRSDGTSNGTYMVKDIWPGGADSSPESLLNVNGTLFFSASTSSSGRELWKTDGTSNGTVMVREIRLGSTGSHPDEFAALNGILFFRASDGIAGHELWRSDGTSNGTARVKDIRPGSPDSTPWDLVSFNGRIFFRADDGVHGNELWTSDGTEAGTFLLADIIEGPVGSDPQNFKVSGGRLFFTANRLDTGIELFAVFREDLCDAPPGLVSWWPMDGDVQDVADMNQPSATNGLSFVPGMVGSGLTLAAGGYVEIPHSANLANQRFTFAAWVRPDGIGPDDDVLGSVVVAKARDGNFYYGLSWNSSGQFVFGPGPWTGSASSVIISSSTFPAGSFYFVATTYDGTNFQLYVNGVLEGQRTSSAAIDYGGPLPWTIGSSPFYPGFRRWNGVIDEVAIFNRALSSNELAAIYAAGSAGFCVPPSPPLIIAQPQNQTALLGSDATFSVTAMGAAPLAYQWYFQNTQIFGANGSSLSLANVQPFNIGPYFVVVSNQFGIVTSAVATASVASPPVIVQPPVSQEAVLNNEAMFTVAATGAAPLAYQWSRNGVPLLNATNTSLVIPAVAAGDAGTYRVAVTNLDGMATSPNALLTVLFPASITAQPTNTHVNLGDSATFCVGVSGTPPIQYQWRQNGANIPDATNACLTIPSVQLTNGGTYNVIIENAYGTAASVPALLTIGAPRTVAPDQFADRWPLTNRFAGIVAGTNAFASKEPGEPDHAGKPGGRSVWYTWIAPTNGIATFRTTGSTFDTLLAIYSGNVVSSLLSVVSDEDGGGFFASEVKFNVTAETLYEIAVDGFGGEGGRFLLSWEVEPTTAALPVITAQPQSQTVMSNASATFTVMATGSGL
ncbi:MAG: immunoglobulin domain-containing protein, partial [Verrucomicrobia subdivision 3 bacterium]|nr:immunoglobulin domain-containing protein [Limisphaerales bacterium]